MIHDHQSCFEPGNRVSWEWQGQRVCGRIQSVHTEPIRRAVSDHLAEKNASPDNPALLIVQDDGLIVIKNVSEVSLESTNMV